MDSRHGTFNENIDEKIKTKVSVLYTPYTHYIVAVPILCLYLTTSDQDICN